MQPLDLVLLFAAPLEQAGFRYFVTGSVAAMVYGEPRLTHDVDIVLELSSTDAERLAELFPLERFYAPPTEVMVVEAKRAQRGHFNLIHHETGFKADIYLRGNDPLHGWASDGARVVQIGGQSVRLAPPEYVIVRKLEYYRDGGSQKHLRDIRAMLATAADAIDREVVATWCSRLGLQSQWREVA